MRFLEMIPLSTATDAPSRHTHYELSALYVAVVLVWATTWYGMKVSVESIPPLFAAGLRFTVAFPFLLLICRFLPDAKLLPPPRSRWMVAVLTISYIAIPYGLINYGEQRTSSGVAAIVFSSVTVLLVVASVILKNACVTFTQWGAIFLGLSLLAVLVIDSGQSLGVKSAWGPVLIFFAACLHAASYAMIAKYGRHINVISLEIIPVGAGGALLLIVGAATEAPNLSAVSLSSWLAVLYLATVASVIASRPIFICCSACHR